MRICKAGIAGRDQDIAGNGDFEPARDRHAINRPDHRFAAQLDRFDRIFIRALGIGCAQRPLLRSQFLQIEPGSERPLPRAGQD